MRCLLLLCALALNDWASAQGQACTVVAEKYEVLSLQSIEKNGPSMIGEPTLLTSVEIDGAECILYRFIEWHNGLHRTQRDSLMDVTGLRIRPECMTKAWSSYYRQYAGERSSDGSIIVHVNLMYENLAVVSGLMKNELDRSWCYVNDGGDSFFTVSVDLYREEVVQYQVNGPYPLDGWCDRK